MFAPRRGASSDFKEKRSKTEVRRTRFPPHLGWLSALRGDETDLQISSWAPPGALQQFFGAPEAPKSDLGAIL